MDSGTRHSAASRQALSRGTGRWSHGAWILASQARSLALHAQNPILQSRHTVRRAQQLAIRTPGRVSVIDAALRKYGLEVLMPEVFLSSCG